MLWVQLQVAAAGGTSGLAGTKDAHPEGELLNTGSGQSDCTKSLPHHGETGISSLEILLISLTILVFGIWVNCFKLIVLFCFICSLGGRVSLCATPLFSKMISHYLDAPQFFLFNLIQFVKFA